MSTFVYPTGDGNLTFALTVVNGGGDVYMHLSAPASYQWVGIGTGSKMAGSVMFIVYENADKLSQSPCYALLCATVADKLKVRCSRLGSLTAIVSQPTAAVSTATY